MMGYAVALANRWDFPVLLVFDGRAMARSSAAFVPGCIRFDHVSGVTCGDMIQQAVEGEMSGFRKCPFRFCVGKF